MEKCMQNRSPKRMNEVQRRNKLRPGKKNKWFVHEEAALVEAIASLIVPSDEETPGADEMDVLGSSAVSVINSLVANCTERQTVYAGGLIAIDEFSERIHGSKFLDLPVPSQTEL